MLQGVLKDHEEVNKALTIIQSRERSTNQDYLALNELVSALLPFKEAMQQIEGENIVTCSCICPVVVGLKKALEQLKNSNLSYWKNSAKTFQGSVSKRLLPIFNSIDNRLASLLDPRFKDKWTEDDIQKKKLCVCCKCMSLVGLVNAKKTVVAPAQMITKSLPKSQGYLALSQPFQKRENLIIQ